MECRNDREGSDHIRGRKQGDSGMSMSDFPKPRFDPTINLGHLISLGGILFALTGSWWLMDHRIASLERQIDKLAVIVVDSAILRQQVQDHNRRIDRLENK